MRQLIFILLISLPFGLLAQNGCTDSTANNFDPNAIQNNGSCLYNRIEVKPMFKTALSQVSESSGVVYTGGKLWTFGDSGNPAEIFSIDTTTGAIIQSVHIRNFPNTDWEDITADSDYIYVGDLGNNNGDRTDLRILKIAKNDIGVESAVSVSAQAISIAYADQSSFLVNDKTNFDCEAILSMGDSLYLFTKDRGDFQTRVYAVSKMPGAYQLSPYTSYNVNGQITGADFNPKTKEVVLIGYMGSKLNSFLWILNDFKDKMFFSGNKRRIEIGNSTTPWQTEGITYADSSRLFISCETTPEVPAALFSIDKDFNSLLSTGVIETKANKHFQCFPNPASKYVKIMGNEVIKRIEVYNAAGIKQFETSVQSADYNLLLSEFSHFTGIYYIHVVSQSGLYVVKILVINQ